MLNSFEIEVKLSKETDNNEDTSTLKNVENVKDKETDIDSVLYTCGV